MKAKINKPRQVLFRSSSMMVPPMKCRRPWYPNQTAADRGNIPTTTTSGSQTKCEKTEVVTGTSKPCNFIGKAAVSSLRGAVYGRPPGGSAIANEHAPDPRRVGTEFLNQQVQNARDAPSSCMARP